MGSLLLLAGESRDSVSGAGTAAFWDRLDVPAGTLSVPGRLAADLADIRRELLAWVYELGRARVRGAQVQEHLRCGDALSMWWCSLLFEKHPKVTPALYPALKLRALERMVEEGGYKAIHLRGGDAPLREALRSFCAATGREFFHEPAAGDRSRGGQSAFNVKMLYYALPGPCKAVLRFAAWLWRKRLLPRITAPRPQDGGDGGTIATYFPNLDAEEAAAGRFRSRYWESLHDALGEEGAPAVNWLFVAFPSPRHTLRQCLELRKAFAARYSRHTFHYLEEFLGAGGIWRAVRRYARLARAGRSLEKDVRPLFRLAGSRMDLWPHIGRYWKDSFGGWRALERCLHREAMSAFTQWAGRQRWTIFPMENCPWERMLTQAVRAAGHGPVYGMQHSTVRPTDFRYFDDARAFAAPDCAAFQPDRIFGNGQGARREMLAAGTPAQRLGVVEALRYMYLADRAASVPGSGPLTRLLAVTGFFADETDEHIRTLARWMALPRRMPLEVAIKPHPYLAVEPYLERYFPQGGAPGVTREPLERLLKSGVAVWASNSTTAALEAALMGLPVLAQLPADGVDLCPLQGVESVARIATAEQAEQALRQPGRVRLEDGYLALDPALPRWREALGLRPPYAV